MKKMLVAAGLMTAIAFPISAEDVKPMNVAFSDGRPFPAELKAALGAHQWIRDYYH